MGSWENVLAREEGEGTGGAEVLAWESKWELKARINRAIAATRDNLIAAGGNGTPVDWNVTPVYTFNSAIPDNKFIMVLPGNKIQNAVYLQELALKKQDMETLNENTSYWTAFGAVVADNDQCTEASMQ